MTKGSGTADRGYMREYLTPDQFMHISRAVATDAEIAIKNWAAKSGMKEAHLGQSFQQTRDDVERGQFEAPPLIVSACPERGTTYELEHSNELL